MAFVRAACLRCTREGDGKDRVPVVSYNYLSNPRESSIQNSTDQIRSDQISRGLLKRNASLTFLYIQSTATQSSDQQQAAAITATSFADLPSIYS